MIQDIGARQFSNEWLMREPKAEDKVYFFRGREVLTDAEMDLPRYEQVRNLDGVELRYLFHIDEEYYYLGVTDEAVELEGYCYRIGRDLRAVRPMDKALAGFTAMHLNGWYRSNRFCGRCGHAMVTGTDERKMVCPHCKSMVYPRINPAVIVAVTDGDRLLMTKYSAKAHTVHHYVLIAGFVEIGETAEQTVAREVLEEAGVKVKNIRYFGSQPWGCDGNLTLGYYAELDGDDHLTRDTEELADARWFNRAEVPVPKDDVSVTSAMIRCFAEGREREKV